MFPRVWNCCQVCRVWHRLHASPRLALVTCFSAFETVTKFTAFDTVYMLHPVKTVPKFAAFHTGYMFLRGWYCVWRWLHVSPGLKLFPSLPRLTMVTSFPAFETVSKFAAFDTGLYKFFAAFKTPPKFAAFDTGSMSPAFETVPRSQNALSGFMLYKEVKLPAHIALSPRSPSPPPPPPSTGVDFYLVRRRRPASPKWRITGLSSTRYCRLAWWKRYSVSVFSLQVEYNCLTLVGRIWKTTSSFW